MSKSGFRILHRGIFDANHVVVDYLAFHPSYPREITEFIDRKWNQALGTSTKLFDGKLFSLVDSHVHDSTLRLKVCNGSYKEFYVIRSDEFRKRYGGNIDINPLSGGVLAETRDGKIIFGRRSLELDLNPGLFSIPAGSVDGELDFTDGVPDPFKALKRELREEMSVEESEILDLKCLGLVYNTPYRQSYLAFHAVLGIESDAILSRTPYEQEFTEAIFVNSDTHSLESFLASNYNRMSQTCAANLTLFLQQMRSDITN